MLAASCGSSITRSLTKMTLKTYADLGLPTRPYVIYMDVGKGCAGAEAFQPYPKQTLTFGAG